MPKFAIVRKPQGMHNFKFDYLVFFDGVQIGPPEASYEAAVLAVFDYSGWTGDYTIRFCDDEEIYKAGLEQE